MQADKQDLYFSNDKTEHLFDNEWKITQSPNGEIRIQNLAGPNLFIDDARLEINQEKKLSGGETLSFEQDKISYVFLPADYKPNNLKRTREINIELTPNPDQENTKLLKVEADLQKEIMRSICTETLSQCATLNPCYHSFCSSCLFDHLRQSSECPLCRSEAISVTKNSMLCNLVRMAVMNFPALERSKEQKLTIQEELRGNIVRDGNGLYVGSLVDGKKDGQGKYGCSNGEVYEGFWKNNKKAGKGVLLLSNGDRYEGSFQNDIYNGAGKFTWSDGKEYEGNLVNGLRDGYGIMKLNNGSIYKGDWKNDEREGTGVYIWSTGDIYEGSWTNNSRNGMGKYTLHNGDEYEGNWVEGRKSGAGTMKYTNGLVYRGEWDDGRKEGNGVLTLVNGDKFEGKWVNDTLQPKVKIEYLNGDLYEGEIDVHSLKKEGKGVLTLMRNGDKVTGSWVNDIIQPEVKIEYLNGDLYEGEIDGKNFTKRGKGVLIFGNGDQFNGNWVDDKQHGYGRYVWRENKVTYEGLWEDAKISGEGTLIYADGTRLKGRWEKIEEGQKEAKEETKERGLGKKESQDQENDESH